MKCPVCSQGASLDEFQSSEKFDKEQGILWNEFKMIFGNWSLHLPDNKFCLSCVKKVLSIVKTKLEVLECMMKVYSISDLESYLQSLQHLVRWSSNYNCSFSILDDTNVTGIENLALETSNVHEISDEKLQDEMLVEENSLDANVYESNKKICCDVPNDANDILLAAAVTEVSLDSSNKQVEEDKLFQCGICQFNSSSRSEVKKHSLKHKIGGRFVCEICGATFKRKYSCVFHQSIHSDLRPYNCSFCGRGFNWQSLLKRHERLHTGEKPYKCDLCERKFRLLGQLHKHKRSHSTGEQDKIISDTRNVCEKCGKLYSSNEALHRHLKSHNRKHQCLNCEFSTENEDEFNKHQNLHAKSRRFPCLICQKAFIRREHLTRHLRIHSGETPYRCPVCNKGFAQSQDAKKHERIHTGEKPFCCQLCGRSFSSKLSVKRHKCVTTDDKGKEESDELEKDEKIKQNVVASESLNAQNQNDVVENCTMASSGMNETSIVTTNSNLNVNDMIINHFSLNNSIMTAIAASLSNDMNVGVSSGICQNLIIPQLSSVDETNVLQVSGIGNQLTAAGIFEQMERPTYIPGACSSLVSIMDQQNGLNNSEVALQLTTNVSNQNVLVLDLQDARISDTSSFIEHVESVTDTS